MDAETKAKLQVLEDNGYWPKLREFVMSKCAPFFRSSQADGEPPKLLHNGTVTFVRSGQRDFAITAQHVFQQFKEDLEALPRVEAQFGQWTIYPEKRLIAADKELDLATFDVPEVFVVSGGKQYHAPAVWPPPALQENEVVVYGGFPGSLRTESAQKVDSPFQTFAWRVSDVTDTNIVMHLAFEHLFWPGHEGEKINQNPGGISGGPVFRLIEKLGDKPPTVGLELVGIIYEYLEPYEVMRARPIRHVLADGRLLGL